MFRFYLIYSSSLCESEELDCFAVFPVVMGGFPCFLYKAEIIAAIMIIRSQGPRGLRRGPAAARLLSLWFLFPPRAWMFVVSVVCCQVEVSATS